ncbi:MAG: YjgP/YjgQ family permease [Chitinophagaceae bacterium]
MKKLDILITRAFLGPFVVTFFITLLVLVMQFFWLYIDDFVGKGLSPSVIFEFIWYQMAVLVPLALPLSVLLSSLMTFGNLGESFELVAIKSAGISLLRFMRPLFIITLLLCFLSFLFANYIMPVATLKSRTLLGDIYFAKPAFELQEGVFYNKIDGFAIKVGRKEKDSIIHDVIIYEKGGLLQDNFIVAKKGVMKISDNRRFLEMRLFDGWRYEERGDNLNSDFIRIGFKEYKKQFDLSSLQFTRTPDSVYKGNQAMLNMRQLKKAEDSLKKQLSTIQKRESNEVFGYFQFTKYLDSSWQVTTDSEKPAASFDKILPDSVKQSVNQRALNQLVSAKSNNDIIVAELKAKRKEIRLHQMEWHSKIALSLACLVLFLIGAPLGSIIRKGGLGSPLIFSIIFFIVFYFINNTGRKMAKEGTVDPFTGMWMATIVLLPIGIFLTYKAMRDSQLFNKEFYFRLKGKFRTLLRKN